MNTPIVRAAVLWLSILASSSARAAEPSTVEVRLSPERVVLGDDGPQDVQIEVLVRDARGAPFTQADVLLHTTAGSIGELTNAGPGRFVGTLKAPSQRFPQLAVVTAADVAQASRGAPPSVGVGVVAFAAKIELKGRAEPRASMRAVVAGATFGPTRADERGDFALPIVVPPGETWATGISADALGNTSKERINLYLPQVPRVHGFVFPPEVVADGDDRAWLFVTTTSAAGAPEAAAKVSVVAQRGALSEPQSVARGVTRYTYVAPKGVGDGGDRVSMKHAASAVDFAVKLVAHVPAQLAVSVTPRVVEADGESTAQLVARVVDAYGNPAAGHAVTAVVGDQRMSARERALGVYEVDLPARATVGTVPIDVEVTPQTRVCRRPRVARDGATARVVDARGVACTGAVRWLDAAGKVLGEALGAWEEARVALRGGARLEVEGALPRVATLADDSAAAAVLRAGVAVPYVVPAPVKLRLVPAGSALVRLEVEGLSGASGRVEVLVGGAPARVTVRDERTLEIAVDSVARPVSVVARDRVTGTSAWLRLP